LAAAGAAGPSGEAAALLGSSSSSLPKRPPAGSSATTAAAGGWGSLLVQRHTAYQQTPPQQQQEAAGEGRQQGSGPADQLTRLAPAAGGALDLPALSAAAAATWARSGGGAQPVGSSLGGPSGGAAMSPRPGLQPAAGGVASGAGGGHLELGPVVVELQGALAAQAAQFEAFRWGACGLGGGGPITRKARPAACPRRLCTHGVGWQQVGLHQRHTEAAGPGAGAAGIRRVPVCPAVVVRGNTPAHQQSLHLLLYSPHVTCCCGPHLQGGGGAVDGCPVSTCHPAGGAAALPGQQAGGSHCCWRYRAWSRQQCQGGSSRRPQQRPAGWGGRWRGRRWREQHCWVAAAAAAGGGAAGRQ
jgi:hypothetical protein